mmetsp:Transcript_8060/g.23939  ORF Transcript_8060/g.23939 Transcript_8060/m.23939 type:complete len:204 (+) Transcript_8060:885-1496(+)
MPPIRRSLQRGSGAGRRWGQTAAPLPAAAHAALPPERVAAAAAAAASPAVLQDQCHAALPGLVPTAEERQRAHAQRRISAGHVAPEQRASPAGDSRSRSLLPRQRQHRPHVALSSAGPGDSRHSGRSAPHGHCCCGFQPPPIVQALPLSTEKQRPRRSSRLSPAAVSHRAGLRDHQKHGSRRGRQAEAAVDAQTAQPIQGCCG